VVRVDLFGLVCRHTTTSPVRIEDGQVCVVVDLLGSSWTLQHCHLRKSVFGVPYDLAGVLGQRHWDVGGCDLVRHHPDHPGALLPVVGVHEAV
jgi:hypothetical protein